MILQIGNKFVYSKVEGAYRAEEVKKALGLLCDAGIIKRVSHTAANGLPLGAETNEKFRKYIYLDSGLLLRILDMDLGSAQQLTELVVAGTAEDLVNKGGLAEMVLGWELIKYNNPRPQHDLYYWENTAESTPISKASSSMNCRSLMCAVRHKTILFHRSSIVGGKSTTFFLMFFTSPQLFYHCGYRMICQPPGVRLNAGVCIATATIIDGIIIRQVCTAAPSTSSGPSRSSAGCPCLWHRGSRCRPPWPSDWEVILA